MVDTIEEIKSKIEKLIDTETAYSLSENSGIPRQAVTDLMTGKSDLSKAKFITIEKLYRYASRPYYVEVKFDELDAGTDLFTILYVQIVHDSGPNYTVEELFNEIPNQDEDRINYVATRLKELGYNNFSEVIEV